MGTSAAGTGVCWVPEHENITGNEETDLRARNTSAAVGTFDPIIGESVHTPLWPMKKNIDDDRKNKWERRWPETQT